jgi:hypothetical protein
MSLNYLGVGLSKTGTTTLCEAMTMLGFRSLHWAPRRLDNVILGKDQNPDFKIYDDCDFICDIPHAYFFREIERAYPALKFILTERDENEWYRSMCDHFCKKAVRDAPEKALHRIVYGGEDFDNLPEFLYKKRFRDWNETIKRIIPPDKLLVMNICDKSDDFHTLCPFVGKPRSKRTFSALEQKLVGANPIIVGMRHRHQGPQRTTLLPLPVAASASSRYLSAQLAWPIRRTTLKADATRCRWCVT